MPTQSPKFRTQRTDHEIMQAEGMVNADTQAQESDESDNDPNFEEGGGSVTKMFDDQMTLFISDDLVSLTKITRTKEREINFHNRMVASRLFHLPYL